MCVDKRGFLGANGCVCVCVCRAAGAKREQAGRCIVTFIHLSFGLSGAVITAAGGSLLCSELGRRAKSAVNGKKHSGRVLENARTLEEPLCSVSALITQQLCEQRE